MNSLSNKLLLASSCLSLALAAPLPLLGMEPEEPVSIPVAASTPVQEENWKDSLYEFPEIEAGFKMNVFNKLLLHDDRFKDLENQSALFECLEQSGFERRNPKALQCIKQYSTRPFLHINRVNPEKAKKANEVLAQEVLAQISISKQTAQLVQLNGLSYSGYLDQLGLVYQEGVGVEKDPDLARQFFFRSLELDPSARALLSLGLLYRQGAPSVPQNTKIAQLLWERAEARGDSKASNNLASLYWEAENFPKAIEHMKKASEQGNLNSTLNLAIIYYEGKNSVEEDHEQALKYFLKAYNTDGINSASKIKCADHIGVIYFEELPGRPPDYRKSLDFFMKAAIDTPSIQYNIASCYKKLKEHKNAFQWFNKAATQNYPDALYEVAQLFYKGLGTRRNIKKARDYFKRAAKLGEDEDLVLESLYNYAALMKDIDRNTAYIYMLHAAERGLSPAMLVLAGYYLHVKAPDALAKAFFWVEKARELNDPKAQILFDAATKRGPESEDASKDDDNLVECIESLEQPKVENFLEVDPSDEEEVKPVAVEDYTITPQEAEQWQAEQLKWKEDIKNPKFVREKLREAHQSFQNKQEVKERPPLSSAAEKIIGTLKDNNLRSKITIDNLFSLFEDPYFQGQVDMFKTTDGYAIVSYNFSHGNTKTTTGTHRKHNKSYKGLDLNFLKSVAELVEEFRTPTAHLTNH